MKKLFEFPLIVLSVFDKIMFHLKEEAQSKYRYNELSSIGLNLFYRLKGQIYWTTLLNK
jgi:hypothetical protein